MVFVFGYPAVWALHSERIFPFSEHLLDILVKNTVKKYILTEGWEDC